MFGSHNMYDILDQYLNEVEKYDSVYTMVYIYVVFLNTRNLLSTTTLIHNYAIII